MFGVLVEGFGWSRGKCQGYKPIEAEASRGSRLKLEGLRLRAELGFRCLQGQGIRVYGISVKAYRS